jgi:hypothetical protein
VIEIVMNQPIEIGKHVKMPEADWLKWSQRMILQHNLDLQSERLNFGKDESVVYFPFISEYGHFWMHYVRLIHFSTAKYKIVCCARGQGQEVCFPHADEFYYEWINPLKDDEKQGTDRFVREWPEIEKHFKEKGLSYAEEKMCIQPETRITFKPKIQNDPRLKVDCLFGTRYRTMNPQQNWQHCQLIADECTKRGLTFATIAHPSTGYHLIGEKCMSGEFPTIDAGIQLIQSAKFYFSQDSGCAHLASTIGIDMAVLTVPHRIWAEIEAKKHGIPLMEWGRDFIDRMQDVNIGKITHRIAPEKWFKPEEVVKEIIPFLDKIEKPKRGRPKKVLDENTNLHSSVQQISNF